MAINRRGAALLAGALVAVLTAQTGSTAQATGARTEDTVCNAMHTLKVPTDESAEAAQILAGTVDLGKYGTMTLAKNPTWVSQSTLDVAGNRYVHSLNWALPLLREGTHGTSAATADTARFVYLLKDWVKDHPSASRTAAMNQPQYGVFGSGPGCARTGC